MANSLGKLFTITSFGESHGRCIGIVIDGCPPGLAVTEEDIYSELKKRKPEAGTGATERAEKDRVEILSGIFKGKTSGAPICILVWNKDVNSTVYEEARFLPRPGHADYTAFVKYGGFNDYRGGGRFSGRLTTAFVMSGTIAKKLLNMIGVEILAHTIAIGDIRAKPKGIDEIRQNVGLNPLKCADLEAAVKMAKAIEQAKEDRDSLGGVIEGIALNVPTSLGEPVFDTLDGEMAKALFAIPAIKGVEFGSGFSGTGKRGSENNDPFTVSDNKIETITNNAGGILGGISNGMPIVVRVAVKATPSIARSQQTVNIKSLENTILEIKGRHDTCITPRAVAVVESMIAITLCDFAIRARSIPEVIK